MGRRERTRKENKESPRDKYRSAFIDFVCKKIQQSALPEERKYIYNTIQVTLNALDDYVEELGMDVVKKRIISPDRGPDKVRRM